MPKEIRSSKPEFRATEKDGVKRIGGYAAVFNSLSEGLGWFREKILPGAFRDALKSSDTVALINHDSNLVIGRKSAGTLRLNEDENGLFMEVDLPETSYANDLFESIKRGDIEAQSFSFSVDTDEWHMENGDEIRDIVKVKELYDVSPVTYPAYQDTDVAKRSLDKKKSDAIVRNDRAIVIEDEDIEVDLILNRHQGVK